MALGKNLKLNSVNKESSFINNDTTNIRHYDVKRSITNHPVDNNHIVYSNQNNPYYESRHNHRQPVHHSSGEISGSNRYRRKSYEYLPAKSKQRSRQLQQQQHHYQPQEKHRYDYRIRNDFLADQSDSCDNHDSEYHDNKYHNKYRPNTYGINCHSSNEELDNSNIDYNCSSDSSDRRNKYYQSYNGDCYEPHDSSKNVRTDWNCDDNNFHYYNRRSSTKFNDSCGMQSKVLNSGNKLNGAYVNNNRSDMTKSKPCRRSFSDNSRLNANNKCTSDIYHNQLPKETDNKNYMSLRSTYRRNENIPHSGTRLENNRKQVDRFCHGRSKNLNNAVDDTKRYQMMNNKCNRKKKFNIPPSPPNMGRRNTEFRSPRRNNHSYRDNDRSDNDSCYFEMCKNTNNESSSVSRFGPLTSSRYKDKRVQLDMSDDDHDDNVAIVDDDAVDDYDDNEDDDCDEDDDDYIKQINDNIANRCSSATSLSSAAVSSNKPTAQPTVHSYPRHLPPPLPPHSALGPSSALISASPSVGARSNIRATSIGVDTLHQPLSTSFSTPKLDYYRQRIFQRDQLQVQSQSLPQSQLQSQLQQQSQQPSQQLTQQQTQQQQSQSLLPQQQLQQQTSGSNENTTGLQVGAINGGSSLINRPTVQDELFVPNSPRRQMLTNYRIYDPLRRSGVDDATEISKLGRSDLSDQPRYKSSARRRLRAPHKHDRTYHHHHHHHQQKQDQSQDQTPQSQQQQRNSSEYLSRHRYHRHRPEHQTTYKNV